MRDALARLDPARHRHHDRVRGRRQCRRANAARRAGCSGAAGRQRHHTARGVARERRAGSAPPISPCMWCCPSLMAAFSPAPSPSRMRCRRKTRSPSPRWRAGPRLIALPWSPTASRRWCACARCRAAQRRVAVLMPDYPGAPGRTGYAVGLDVPASVLALLDDLTAAGYAVSGRAGDSRALLDALAAGADDVASTLPQYEALLAAIPAAAVARLREAWGEPADDPDCRDGAFSFPRQTIREGVGGAAARSRPQLRSAAPIITIPRCRRGMRWWLSVYGCSMSPRSTRSCTWARTARWNGCPARRWRSRRTAFRKSSPGRCR